MCRFLFIKNYSLSNKYGFLKKFMYVYLITYFNYIIMKKFTFIIYAMVLFVFLSCSTEKITEDTISQDPNFRVTESVINNSIINFGRTSLEEPCMTTNLIAGQHYIAGTVTVDTDGENLIITYTTNEEWTIGATHMSIGNCDEQAIPTTGSGNPKVGKFEHSTTHSDGVNEVTYTISMSVANEVGAFCFAAHAEVSGPTGGETAWAEGSEFDGKSWAMFVEANVSDCDVVDDDGGVK